MLFGKTMGASPYISSPPGSRGGVPPGGAGETGTPRPRRHPPLPLCSPPLALKVFPPECLPDDNRIPFIYIRQTRAQGG